MATLIIKDFHWTRISKELKLLDNSFTKVGFPLNAQVGQPSKKVKGQDIKTDMSEIATIAAFQEWGTKRTQSKRSGGAILNIPPRPFMSTSFDENLEGLNNLRSKLYNKIITGHITVKQALSLIGDYMENKTKKKIDDIKDPPNSPITIKKKKSDNPLINNGQMRNSVTHIEVIK